ncbi:MAG: sugar transferase [Candidatus Omnitrophica bacterium]|nr:sugar transferase [Candidatus Omnitrophota bacterium]
MPNPLSKRLFDVCLSLFGIIISLPLWLLVSILIYVEDKGPIYYLQDRVGQNGRIFKIIKFRSMIPNAEQNTGPVQAKENDERITKIGKVLRKTAMDELPQLINILKGDMSFVGPRALRPYEVEVKTKILTDLIHQPDTKIRHSVKPGLTGPAQIFVPADIPTPEKLKYDRWYIRYNNLTMDIWFIFLSFLITFRGRWSSRNKKLKFLDSIRLGIE